MGYLAAAAALYFAPFLIALLRRHRNTVSILLTNLLLGWTGIGWIVALIWSAANEGKGNKN